MIKYCILWVCLSAATSLAQRSEYFTQDELDVHFERFKVDFDRFYETASEELERKQIFSTNLDFIFRHNAEAARGLHSYTVAVNSFADLTMDEVRSQFMRKSSKKVETLMQMEHQARGIVHTNVSVEGLPASVDWVDRGVVTPVKFQGIDSFAWAFTGAAVIESAHAIKSGHLQNLSHLQIEDCCDPFGIDVDRAANVGGYWPAYDLMFKCLIKQGGIDTESSYPHPDPNSYACKFNPNGVASRLTSYGDIVFGSEASLQNAVATVGPVAVEIGSGGVPAFVFYHSGVYDNPNCSSTVLDFFLAVVGYGESQDGKQYWKAKNSWGTRWGMDGYILMSRNKQNQCGISDVATYPIVQH